uniref:Uncharacterized protein n=1 Tax=Clytia hemisphaerica TaxID=252671 RepID=A0A7M5X174_9CNID
MQFNEALLPFEGKSADKVQLHDGEYMVVSERLMVQPHSACCSLCSSDEDSLGEDENSAQDVGFHSPSLCPRDGNHEDSSKVEKGNEGRVGIQTEGDDTPQGLTHPSVMDKQQIRSVDVEEIFVEEEDEEYEFVEILSEPSMKSTQNVEQGRSTQPSKHPFSTERFLTSPTISVENVDEEVKDEMVAEDEENGSSGDEFVLIEIVEQYQQRQSMDVQLDNLSSGTQLVEEIDKEVEGEESAETDEDKQLNEFANERDEELDNLFQQPSRSNLQSPDANANIFFTKPTDRPPTMSPQMMARSISPSLLSPLPSPGPKEETAKVFVLSSYQAEVIPPRAKTPVIEDFQTSQNEVGKLMLAPESSYETEELSPSKRHLDYPIETPSRTIMSVSTIDIKPVYQTTPTIQLPTKDMIVINVDLPKHKRRWSTDLIVNVVQEEGDYHRVEDRHVVLVFPDTTYEEVITIMFVERATPSINVLFTPVNVDMVDVKSDDEGSMSPFEEIVSEEITTLAMSMPDFLDDLPETLVDDQLQPENPLSNSLQVNPPEDQLQPAKEDSNDTKAPDALILPKPRKFIPTTNWPNVDEEKLKSPTSPSPLSPGDRILEQPKFSFIRRIIYGESPTLLNDEVTEQSEDPPMLVGSENSSKPQPEVNTIRLGEDTQAILENESNEPFEILTKEPTVLSQYASQPKEEELDREPVSESPVIVETNIRSAIQQSKVPELPFHGTSTFDKPERKEKSASMDQRPFERNTPIEMMEHQTVIVDSLQITPKTPQVVEEGRVLQDYNEEKSLPISEPKELISEDLAEEAKVPDPESNVKFGTLLPDEQADDRTTPKPSYYQLLSDSPDEPRRRSRVWSNSTTDSECDIVLIEIEHMSTDDELDAPRDDDHLVTTEPIDEDNIIPDQMKSVESELDFSSLYQGDETPKSPVLLGLPVDLDLLPETSVDDSDKSSQDEEPEDKYLPKRDRVFEEFEATTETPLQSQPSYDLDDHSQEDLPTVKSFTRIQTITTEDTEPVEEQPLQSASFVILQEQPSAVDKSDIPEKDDLPTVKSFTRTQTITTEDTEPVEEQPLQSATFVILQEQPLAVDERDLPEEGDLPTVESFTRTQTITTEDTEPVEEQPLQSAPFVMLQEQASIVDESDLPEEGDLPTVKSFTRTQTITTEDTEPVEEQPLQSASFVILQEQASIVDKSDLPKEGDLPTVKSFTRTQTITTEDTEPVEEQPLQSASFVMLQEQPSIVDESDLPKEGDLPIVKFFTRTQTITTEDTEPVEEQPLQSASFVMLQEQPSIVDESDLPKEGDLPTVKSFTRTQTVTTEDTEPVEELPLQSASFVILQEQPLAVDESDLPEEGDLPTVKSFTRTQTITTEDTEPVEEQPVQSASFVMLQEQASIVDEIDLPEEGDLPTVKSFTRTQTITTEDTEPVEEEPLQSASFVMLQEQPSIVDESDLPEEGDLPTVKSFTRTQTITTEDTEPVEEQPLQSASFVMLQEQPSIVDESDLPEEGDLPTVKSFTRTQTITTEDTEPVKEQPLQSASFVMLQEQPSIVDESDFPEEGDLPTVKSFTRTQTITTEDTEPVKEQPLQSASFVMLQEQPSAVDESDLPEEGDLPTAKSFTRTQTIITEDTEPAEEQPLQSASFVVLQEQPSAVDESDLPEEGDLPTVKSFTRTQTITTEDTEPVEEEPLQSASFVVLQEQPSIVDKSDLPKEGDLPTVKSFTRTQTITTEDTEPLKEQPLQSASFVVLQEQPSIVDESDLPEEGDLPTAKSFTRTQTITTEDTEPLKEQPLQSVSFVVLQEQPSIVDESDLPEEGDLPTAKSFTRTQTITTEDTEPVKEQPLQSASFVMLQEQSLAVDESDLPKEGDLPTVKSFTRTQTITTEDIEPAEEQPLQSASFVMLQEQPSIVDESDFPEEGDLPTVKSFTRTQTIITEDTEPVEEQPLQSASFVMLQEQPSIVDESDLPEEGDLPTVKSFTRTQTITTEDTEPAEEQPLQSASFVMLQEQPSIVDESDFPEEGDLPTVKSFTRTQKITTEDTEPVEEQPLQSASFVMLQEQPSIVDESDLPEEGDLPTVKSFTRTQTITTEDIEPAEEQPLQSASFVMLQEQLSAVDESKDDQVSPNVKTFTRTKTITTLEPLDEHPNITVKVDEPLNGEEEEIIIPYSSDHARPPSRQSVLQAEREVLKEHDEKIHDEPIPEYIGLQTTSTRPSISQLPPWMVNAGDDEDSEYDDPQDLEQKVYHQSSLIKSKPERPRDIAISPYLLPSFKEDDHLGEELSFTSPEEEHHRTSPPQHEGKLVNLFSTDDRTIEQQSGYRSPTEFIVQYTINADDVEQPTDILRSQTSPARVNAPKPIYDVFWNEPQEIPRSKSVHEFPSSRRRSEDIHSGIPRRSNSFDMTNRRNSFDGMMFRPKNLFFWKNTNIARSMSSLNSYNTSDSADSFMEEDLEVNDWLDSASPVVPKSPRSLRAHTLKADTDALQRIEPIKSRGMISVKPKRVANWLTSLFPQQPQRKTNYQSFKKSVVIPEGLVEEEVYFVYCYLHGGQKWKIGAKTNKFNEMTEVSAIRRRGPYQNQPSDLPVDEIENRLLELANERQQKGLPMVDGDHIMYTSLQSDDALVQTVRHDLNKKRSRNVADIARWLVVLREAKDDDIHTFNDFQETFPQLKEISEYDQFLLYALVYDPPHWKVNLDTNPGGSVYGVHFEHQPDGDVISNLKVRNILIKTALNDEDTREELARLGFILPESDSSPYQISRLPTKLRRFEKRLSTAEQPTRRLSLWDFEQAFPEISDLDEEDKLLLYAYFHGEQQWEVMIESKDGSTTLVSDIKLKTTKKHPTTPTKDFSFDHLDTHDDICETDMRTFYNQSAYPSTVSKLIDDWSKHPTKEQINSFDEFKQIYHELKPKHSEFDAFVVYTLIHNPEKWRTVLEVDPSMEKAVIHVQLRDMHKDSQPFLFDFLRPEYLSTLNPSHTREKMNEVLQEHKFNPKVGYKLNSSPRVDSLPIALSEHSNTLNQENTPLPTLAAFQEFFPQIAEMPLSEQHLMFAYYNALHQWDIELNLDQEDLLNQTPFEERKRGGRTLRPGRTEGRARTMTTKHRRRPQQQRSLDDTLSDERRRVYTVGNQRYRSDPHKRASYTGPMKLVMIDLSRVAHVFPILDRDQMENEDLHVTSYNEYRLRLSLCVQNPEVLTEQEMYALYCYYYGKAIQRILHNNPEVKEMEMVSHDISRPELPRVHIIALNMARWIQYLINKRTTFPLKSFQQFTDSLPSIKSLNQPEQYALYCFMYGRSLEIQETPPITPTNPQVVEAIHSPITPQTLHSEANMSFTPMSTRTDFSIPRSFTLPERPKSTDPFIDLSTTGGRHYTFSDQDSSVSFPRAARSIDAYSQHSRDDLSTIFGEAVEFDDELSPVDYTTRRQTEIHLSQLKTIDSPEVSRVRSPQRNDSFEFVDFNDATITHTEPSDESDFRRRLQTEVKSAKVRHSNLQPDNTEDGFISFDQVKMSHENQQTSSYNRPRLQTEVHSAQLERQKSREKKKRKKSKKKSKGENENVNYRTPTTKRRSFSEKTNDEDPEKYFSRF